MSGHVQKHCLTSESNKLCGVMFLKKFKHLTQTENVERAMFLDVAIWSNILLDQQISNVGPKMFGQGLTFLTSKWREWLNVTSFESNLAL